MKYEDNITFFFKLLFVAFILFHLNVFAVNQAHLLGFSKCFSLRTPLSTDQIASLTTPNIDLLKHTEVVKMTNALMLENHNKRICKDNSKLTHLSSMVNNLISYGFEVDSRFFGKPDYWQTAEETLQIKVKSTGERVGDCEDIALLKYWILRALGCDDSKMYVAVVKNVDAEVAHAILLVNTGHEYLVLDNFPSENGKAFVESKYFKFKAIQWLINENKTKFICGFPATQ